METFLKLVNGNVELYDNDGNCISVIWDEGNAISAEWIDQKECIIRVKVESGLSFKVIEGNCSQMIICENRPRKKKRPKVSVKNPLPNINLPDNMPEIDKRNFLELISIINWYDPAELIGFGFPETEYISEVSSIFSRLETVRNETEILDMVYEEFERMFSGTVGPKRKFKRIAKEIFECIVVKKSKDN